MLWLKHRHTHNEVGLFGTYSDYVVNSKKDIAEMEGNIKKMGCKIDTLEGGRGGSVW